MERPKVPDQSVKRELQVVSHIDVNAPALLVSLPSPLPPPLPSSLPSVLLCTPSRAALARPVTFSYNLVTRGPSR